MLICIQCVTPIITALIQRRHLTANNIINDNNTTTSSMDAIDEVNIYSNAFLFVYPVFLSVCMLVCICICDYFYVCYNIYILMCLCLYVYMANSACNCMFDVMSINIYDLYLYIYLSYFDNPSVILLMTFYYLFF